jgi:hypothetical protein
MIDETLNLSTVKDRTRSKSKKYNIQQAKWPPDSEDEEPRPSRHKRSQRGASVSRAGVTANFSAETRTNSQVPPARSLMPQGERLAAASQNDSIRPTACSCAQDRRAPKGSTRAPTTFKLQEYHEKTCVSDQQTRSPTTRSEEGVCNRAGDYHDGVPTGRHHGRRRGIGQSSSIRPRGAAPTSPPEGVLRHMRHQERERVVGTHYGPTRIYGPTGHAIGGTAKQLANEGQSDTALRDRRLSDRRERADAPVRSTGLGECRKLLDSACAGYLLFLLAAHSF